jgi:hypothetical protein
VERSVPRIAVSYRRSDSDVIAGRIRDKLASHFGDDSVFIDIDNIPVGFDFREQIKEELLKTDALLVVIGPKWRGPGRGGQARINDDNDPVRVEVETALQRNIPVVPVLVGGAEMPKPEELPESLKKFSFFNAAIVDASQDFHLHMDRLIRSLERVLNKQPTEPVESLAPAKPSRLPKIAVALGGLALVAAAIAGTWLYMTQFYLPKMIGGQHIAAGSPNSAPIIASNPPTSGNGGAGASPRCNSGRPIVFDDDFKTADKTWYQLGEFSSGSNVYFDGGNIVIKAVAKAGTRSVIYPSLVFKSSIVCVALKSPPSLKAPDEAYAGAIFWAADTTNYYAAYITPGGTYTIARLIDNTWAPVASGVKFDAIKQGPDVVNEIEVQIKGNSGTLFINGVKAQDFKGNVPSGVSTVGMIGASEAAQVDEWRFLKIAVSDL